jgi:hypothetical protein
MGEGEWTKRKEKKLVLILSVLEAEIKKLI